MSDFSPEELADRYQNQPPHIKFYRWVRYILPCYPVAVWRLTWWVLRGAPHPRIHPEIPMSRWVTATLIWRVAKCRGEMNAKHYYTTEEVLGNDIV